PSQQTAILAGFCLILTLGQHSRIAIYKNDDHYIFSKGVQWLANESAWAESWKRYGLWLKEKYPPGTLIAVTTAGAVCYFSDLPSLDILGLNDTTVAHTPNPSPDWRYPGHDKSNPDYILSQKPRFIQLFPLLFFSSRPYPEWRLEQMITYPAQRDLWQHPQFQDEYHLRTEETRHGFISYYERKTNP
ncbi:MAG: hypothetical protein RBU29_08520, partial [bacterium]|nr:hypothetical protein [bacterium]